MTRDAMPELQRTDIPDPVAFFARSNRHVAAFVEECPEFSKLVMALATHLSRYARVRKVQPRDIEITTPRILNNGAVYFEVRVEGEALLNKVDEVRFKHADL